MASARHQSARRRSCTTVVADVDSRVERPAKLESSPSGLAVGSSSATKQTGLAASGAVAFEAAFVHAFRDGCCRSAVIDE